MARSPAHRRWIVPALAAACLGSASPGPSFDCDRVEPGGTAGRVCAEPRLAALDRRLSQVYRAALAKADARYRPTLRAQQRGWIKGRDECWKSAAPDDCVAGAYRRRILELQAYFRLAPWRGPVYLACDGNPANEVVVTFFETEPPSLIAERGDSVSLMVRESPASDGFYRGRNESYRAGPQGARIVWGFGARPMDCVAVGDQGHRTP